MKGRVLYDFSSSPPRFALALTDHVIKLGPRRIRASSDAEPWQTTYPVGTIFKETKVLRLEAERGIFVEIEPGLEGFVHVR